MLGPFTFPATRNEVVAILTAPYGAARTERFREQLQRRLPAGADNAARRLRDVLRSEIFSGSFPAGQLPREAELMERYGVRRAVVRRALQMLRDEGMIERVQGLGTFSVCNRATFDLVEMHGTSNDTLVFMPQVRSQVLDKSIVAAPEYIARRLEIEPGERVLRLEYVASVSREPIGICTNYVAFPEAEAIADTPFYGDWYTLLGDAGVTLGETEWVLCAANADEVVADHLEITPGTAVMLAEEMIWDQDHRPYDFAIVYMRTDRYAFSSKSWRIGGRNGVPPMATRAPVRGEPISSRP